MTTTQTEIQSAVSQFFGTRRVCYAIPGTDRHSSNYYGDTHICRFTRSELTELIYRYSQDARTEDGDAIPLDEAIQDILGDMQFDKPE